MIEVLIASGLLLTIVVGVLPLFTRSLINNQMGFESTQISNFGRSQMEEYFQYGFNDAELTIDSGSSKETVDHYSALGQKWKSGEDPDDGDTALWVRTTTVRQFHVSALSDGKLEASEALPSNSQAEYVHVKQVTVELENRTGDNIVRPSQSITIQLYKAQ